MDSGGRAYTKGWKVVLDLKWTWVENVVDVVPAEVRIEGNPRGRSTGGCRLAQEVAAGGEMVLKAFKPNLPGRDGFP